MLRLKFPEDKHNVLPLAAVWFGRNWEVTVPSPEVRSSIVREGCCEAAGELRQKAACPRSWGSSGVDRQQGDLQALAAHHCDWNQGGWSGVVQSLVLLLPETHDTVQISRLETWMWVTVTTLDSYKLIFSMCLKDVLTDIFEFKAFRCRENIINRSSNNSPFGIRRASCLDAMISWVWMFKYFAIANPEFSFKLDNAVRVRACCHWRAASPRGARVGCTLPSAWGGTSLSSLSCCQYWKKKNEFAGVKSQGLYMQVSHYFVATVILRFFYFWCFDNIIAFPAIMFLKTVLIFVVLVLSKINNVDTTILARGLFRVNLFCSFPASP